MERRTYPYRPDYTTPPGYVLQDHIEAKGMTSAEFARRHGLLAGLVESIIEGSAPIDEDLAALFGREFSLEASVWLNMEAIYRRRLADKAAAEAAN